MTAQQMIKAALAYQGMSMADLARRMNKAPQTLQQRISTGKYTFDELQEIAQQIGGEFFCGIRFPDGKEI